MRYYLVFDPRIGYILSRGEEKRKQEENLRLVPSLDRLNWMRFVRKYHAPRATLCAK
jgi:hypothetical protein